MIIRIAILFFAFLGGTSYANDLPAGAKKLTTKELVSIYSGKSSNWPTMRGYFAPNGIYYVYTTDSKYVATGRWKVRGNKVSVSTNWTQIVTGQKGKGKASWIWFKHGGTFYTMHYKNNGRQVGYYTTAKASLSSGDNVTKKHRQLLAKVK